MKTIQRALVLVAALSSLAAVPALAEESHAVKLSDAQLDNITAGSAMVVTAVFNPGNAFVQHFNETLSNVHQVGLPAGVENPFDGGKAKFIMVVNPARTVMKCAGSIGGTSICP
jgi:hypothetical protein